MRRSIGLAALLTGCGAGTYVFPPYVESPDSGPVATTAPPDDPLPVGPILPRSGTGGVLGAGGRFITTDASSAPPSTGGAPSGPLDALCCSFASDATLVACGEPNGWNCYSSVASWCGIVGSCSAGMKCYGSDGRTGGVVVACSRESR